MSLGKLVLRWLAIFGIGIALWAFAAVVALNVLFDLRTPDGTAWLYAPLSAALPCLAAAWGLLQLRKGRPRRWAIAGMSFAFAAGIAYVELGGRWQLRSATEEWIAAGGSLDDAAFVGPAVPDDQNAAVVYRRAVPVLEDSLQGLGTPEAITKETPKQRERRLYGLADTTEPSDLWMDSRVQYTLSDLDKLIAAQHETLAMIRQASMMPAFQWSKQRVGSRNEHQMVNAGSGFVQLLLYDARRAALRHDLTGFEDRVALALRVAEQFDDGISELGFAEHVRTVERIFELSRTMLPDQALPRMDEAVAAIPFNALARRVIMPESLVSLRDIESTSPLVFNWERVVEHGPGVLWGIKARSTADYLRETAASARAFGIADTGAALTRRIKASARYGSNTNWVTRKMFLPPWAPARLATTAEVLPALLRGRARILAFKAENGRYPTGVAEVADMPDDPWDGQPFDYVLWLNGFVLKSRRTHTERRDGENKTVHIAWWSHR